MEVTRLGNMESQAVHDEFMELLRSDLSTWEESDEIENIKIWRRQMPATTTLCLRMVCKFPGISPDIAYNVLADIRIR